MLQMYVIGSTVLEHPKPGSHFLIILSHTDPEGIPTTEISRTEEFESSHDRALNEQLAMVKKIMDEIGPDEEIEIIHTWEDSPEIGYFPGKVLRSSELVKQLENLLSTKAAV